MKPQITQDRLKELLDYNPDTGVFTWRVGGRGYLSGSRAGSRLPKGYRRIKVSGKEYYEHRLAWLYIHGKWPKACIDHIDGVRDKNQISNLREATHVENGQNRVRRSDSACKYIGVSFDKSRGKFEAEISVNGCRKRLGRFPTAEEAAEAYREAKRTLHTFQPEIRS